VITLALGALAVVCMLGCGVVGWRAENRAHAEWTRANALAVTVINQRECIEELEARVRNLGLRNRIMSVELAGSDDRAKTRVLPTALHNPVQWSPDPWQVVGRG
jgi:hypothetical protein